MIHPNRIYPTNILYGNDNIGFGLFYVFDGKVNIVVGKKTIVDCEVYKGSGPAKSAARGTTMQKIQITVST